MTELTKHEHFIRIQTEIDPKIQIWVRIWVRVHAKVSVGSFFWTCGAWVGYGSYPRPDKYPKLIVLPLFRIVSSFN